MTTSDDPLRNEVQSTLYKKNKNRALAIKKNAFTT